ncbi:hypothetical protein F5051DRAFT_446548 [Lentinula edodes]|nr:hypothetical protein F5051DRAFT_446548 [Lentinula edodes]
MLQECPFCDYSSRIDAVIDAHASAHTDDIGEPIMLINGFQHVLKRVKGAAATFQCPACKVEGLKGQVWDHYMEMHGSKGQADSSSSGSQDRQANGFELPPAKKRKVDSHRA